MLKRVAYTHIQEQLANYPAVALLGPRQAGKTTLAKALGGRYFDLEDQGDQTRLDVQWPALMAGTERVVLDEAQAMPEVFARLRVAIDQDRRRNDRFLLLGSVSPALMRQVAESLAGRLAYCDLSPLLACELPTDRADDLWRMGGYPDGGVLDAGRFPGWQTHYLRSLAQRDLPEWGLPAKPSVTERLFRMTAALHGQLWNAAEIGKSLGLSYHTVNDYLGYLEGAFLVRRLPAYFANVSKRLVRSPKIHWRDSGLLHALLGFAGDQSDLLSQPWVGASWEGWVVEQVLGFLTSRGIPHEAFHLRTSDQYEIDLLLRLRGKLWGVEIKLTTAPGPEDMRRLRRAGESIGVHEHILLSRVETPTSGEGLHSLNLPALLERLGQL